MDGGYAPGGCPLPLGLDRPRLTGLEVAGGEPERYCGDGRDACGRAAESCAARRTHRRVAGRFCGWAGRMRPDPRRRAAGGRHEPRQSGSYRCVAAGYCGGAACAAQRRTRGRLAACVGRAGRLTRGTPCADGGRRICGRPRAPLPPEAAHASGHVDAGTGRDGDDGHQRRAGSGFAETAPRIRCGRSRLRCAGSHASCRGALDAGAGTRPHRVRRRGWRRLRVAYRRAAACRPAAAGARPRRDGRPPHENRRSRLPNRRCGSSAQMESASRLRLQAGITFAPERRAGA
jgi:hypothetical protein